ncbi:MAG TPA: hypothetical protein VF469_12100, partial [Kofleriaceae bacterium]
LPDGSIVGEDDHGEIAVVDPATGRTRQTFAASGQLVDVSSDLRHVARVLDGKLAVAPLAGGAPLMEPIATSPGWFAGGSFSPDGRRFGAFVNALAIGPAKLPKPTLYIDDLASRRRVALAFRLHLNGRGATEVRWLDATSFVVSGSAITEIAADLWRVRLDPTGSFAEPPQILQRSERDTILAPGDVQAGKLLITRVTISNQNAMIDGGSLAPLPRSISLRLAAVDRARGLLLAATDLPQTHWVWMSLDGSRVEPIAALDGLTGAVASPTGLAALDLRSEPPAYVALDEAGTEVLRVPIDAPHGERPTLRCGLSRCLVKWVAGGSAYTVAIEGRTVGAPVRHDVPELASRITPWALAPDGKSIAVPIGPWSAALVVYDLEHAALHRVTSEACQFVQLLWFSPDGALLLSCKSGVDSLLVRREAAGRERALWHGEAPVVSTVPLDDHRVVVTMFSYQLRLGLLELH